MPSDQDQDLFHIRSKRKQGWFWIDNEIIERFCPVIGYAALGVYVVLCRRADNAEQSCFPSISGLSRDLKMGRDKVIESLLTLEEVGLIRCDRAGKNSGVTNTYYILDLPEGSPKVGLPIQSEKSQGKTTRSPDVGLRVVPRQDAKEDSSKEDSFNKRESGATIDLIQNLIPWMEKQWRENPATRKLPWRKFNYPSDVEGVADRAGQQVFRLAWTEFIRGPDPDQFRFLREMREAHPKSKTTRSNGNSSSRQKTADQLWIEKHQQQATAT